MMANSCIFQEKEEEDQFFDSRDEISSASDSCPGSPRDNDLCQNSIGWVSNDPLYQVWINNTDSIQERRAKFMRWMGLDPIRSPRLESARPDGELTEDRNITPDIDRITLDDGAVLRISSSDNGASVSSCSNEGPSTSSDGASEENFGYRIKNLDDGSVFVVDQFSEDGTLRSLREVGSDRSITLEEFDKYFGPTSFVQRIMRRKEDDKSNDLEKIARRRKNGWLRRLGAVSCIVDKQGEEFEACTSDSEKSVSSRARRVKVRSFKKRSKEFSAVYMGQDIRAHEGAIVTMKFSPDGKFLASGGEDGVVRVWGVVECERRDEEDTLEIDPSCIYFSVNHNLELAPLFADKVKKTSRSMRKTPDSACVVIPPEVFRISEKPLHEFHGHDGDVLDLSWSKDKCLLSSSVDKTVRLWRVGCNRCLKVFAHNNYVTCVQFNPINEDYFVSGSIDGKVRIWEISGCHVVDWTDIRDIVTAVCYRLDGKGVVVGSMTGDCRFYDASDNHLELDVQVSLQGKKKSLDKRITGFQYCPSDHRKLLVTSADSQVRILDGFDVVSKYKGLRNAGTRISATFTSDGRHIISASEDSNVYVWSHADHNSPTPAHVKSTRACERFISDHASVAVPWQGPASRNPACDFPQDNYITAPNNNNTVYLSPAGSFTLSHGFFSEILPKGSATWPEEKLPPSSLATASSLGRSQYKFLKTSCRNSSHAWGQVIVTAGWDGRIRSFQNFGLPVNF